MQCIIYIIWLVHENVKMFILVFLDGEVDAKEMRDLRLEVSFVDIVERVLKGSFNKRAFTEEYKVVDVETEVEGGVVWDDDAREDAWCVGERAKAKFDEGFFAGIIPVTGGTFKAV